MEVSQTLVSAVVANYTLFSVLTENVKVALGNLFTSQHLMTTAFLSPLPSVLHLQETCLMRRR